MDPNQMMPRSFPMWAPPPPTSSDAMAMPPPQMPFLPPPNASLAPNRGWKRKNPNPNTNSSGAPYQPPAVGDLQVQNRAKARRWFKPNNGNSNPNNGNANPNSGNRRGNFRKPNNKAKAPRNTTSFIMRAKHAGGIAPLVSPCPVTPAVLPTPVISPARDEGLLSDVLAQQQWGVDGYGSMKGLIRLRPANDAPPGGAEEEDEEEGNSSGGSDVEEHVEVERRLDHDLSRFEMVYPQPGGEYVFEEDDDEYGRGSQDDVDVHVARLEEENLTLKERLFLMEREVGDMRRRLEAIEARFSDGAAVGSADNAAAAVDGTDVGNANAAGDDAVEQALANGIERGNANAAAGADNNAAEENDIEVGNANAGGDDAVHQVLENGTQTGSANAENELVEENDAEMGDAAADVDNTFEDSTEKGDVSSASDNAVEKSLENGNVEPEKSSEDSVERCSAGLEKNADASSAQDNGEDSRQA